MMLGGGTRPAPLAAPGVGADGALDAGDIGAGGIKDGDLHGLEPRAALGAVVGAALLTKRSAVVIAPSRWLADLAGFPPELRALLDAELAALCEG